MPLYPVRILDSHNNIKRIIPVGSLRWLHDDDNDETGKSLGMMTLKKLAHAILRSCKVCGRPTKNYYCQGKCSKIYKERRAKFNQEEL